MHTTLDLGLFSAEYHRTLNKHILQYTGAADPAQDQWIQPIARRGGEGGGEGKEDERCTCLPVGASDELRDCA